MDEPTDPPPIVLEYFQKRRRKVAWHGPASLAIALIYYPVMLTTWMAIQNPAGKIAISLLLSGSGVALGCFGMRASPGKPFWRNLGLILNLLLLVLTGVIGLLAFVR